MQKRCGFDPWSEVLPAVMIIHSSILAFGKSTARGTGRQSPQDSEPDMTERKQDDYGMHMNHLFILLVVKKKSLFEASYSTVINPFLVICFNYQM